MTRMCCRAACQLRAPASTSSGHPSLSIASTGNDPGRTPVTHRSWWCSPFHGRTRPARAVPCVKQAFEQRRTCLPSQPRIAAARGTHQHAPAARATPAAPAPQCVAEPSGGCGSLSIKGRPHGVFRRVSTRAYGAYLPKVLRVTRWAHCVAQACTQWPMARTGPGQAASPRHPEGGRQRHAAPPPTQQPWWPLRSRRRSVARGLLLCGSPGRCPTRPKGTLNSWAVGRQVGARHPILSGRVRHRRSTMRRAARAAMVARTMRRSKCADSARSCKPCRRRGRGWTPIWRAPRREQGGRERSAAGSGIN